MMRLQPVFHIISIEIDVSDQKNKNCLQESVHWNENKIQYAAFNDTKKTQNDVLIAMNSILLKSAWKISFTFRMSDEHDQTAYIIC